MLLLVVFIGCLHWCSCANAIAVPKFALIISGCINRIASQFSSSHNKDAVSISDILKWVGPLTKQKQQHQQQQQHSTTNNNNSSSSNKGMFLQVLQYMLL
jgi:organic radical activating enzyme